MRVASCELREARSEKRVARSEQLVFNTPHRKRLRPQGRVEGNGWVIHVHSMRPGFERTMTGGGPEEGGEIIKGPDPVHAVDAVQTCVKT